MSLTPERAAQEEFEATIARGGDPEVDISLDIAKRGVVVAPVLVALSGLVWGLDGAVSAALAVAVVIANFLASAALMALAARISVGALMGSVMFGYLIRLGLILVVLLVVRDAAWFSAPAFGLSILVTHLGLLAWELKYVSLSMAYPGLKPARPTL